MKSEVKTQFTCTTKEVVFDFAGRPSLDIECREPKTPEPLVIESEKWGLCCEIIRHNDFVFHGKWHDKPYLEIQHSDVVRFGHLKARAIIELRDSIENFVIENYQ